MEMNLGHISYGLNTNNMSKKDYHAWFSFEDRYDSRKVTSMLHGKVSELTLPLRS